VEPSVDGTGENPAPQQRKASSTQCGGAVYGLGLIGALVWYWHQADSAGERVVAVGKAAVWPAFLVYGVLRALDRR